MGKVREKKVKRVRRREREKREMLLNADTTHMHTRTHAHTHTDRQIDMKKHGHGHGHGTYDMVNRLRGVLLQACTYCTSLHCCTVLYWMWSRKCGLVSGSVVYRAV